MMYWGSHMTTWDWGFSIFGTLILVALIVVAILSFVSAPSGSDTAAGASAREILDRRLASGEITAEQYDQLRAKLDASTPPGVERLPARPVGAPS
jgi:uncharacterized membrane protein